MTVLDPALRAALDAWAPAPYEADWADVLRRAGRRPRRRGHVATIALAGLIAVLLTIPAFGLAGRLARLIGGASRPGLTLGATLRLSDGKTVGTFSLQGSRLFVAVGPRKQREVRPLRRPGERPIAGAPFRWALDLRSGITAGEARLERVAGPSPRLSIRLCSPCAGRVEGRLRLRRPDLSGAFDGRLAVAVRTERGIARGAVILHRPAR
jgi:hypothetical protein